MISLHLWHQSCGHTKPHDKSLDYVVGVALGEAVKGKHTFPTEVFKQLLNSDESCADGENLGKSSDRKKLHCCLQCTCAWLLLFHQ